VASPDNQNRSSRSGPPRGSGSRQPSKGGGTKGSGGRGGKPSGAKGSGGGRSGKPGGSKGTSGNSGGGKPGGSNAGKAPSAGGSGGRTSGGAPRKYQRNTPKPAERDDDTTIPGNREWGGLARKGVLRANLDERLDAEREAERRDEPIDEEAEAKRVERAARRAERDQRHDELREQARDAVDRANQGKPRVPKRPPSKRSRPAMDRPPLPKGPARNEDEVEALHRLLGPVEAKKQLRKLRAAAESFESERYADSRKSLRSIAELAPTVPEVRELYGLTLYRMGQFKAAAVQLEEFRVLAGSVDQNPVLQDCYRAQGRWEDVDQLWHELAAASPAADLVNEGRIVMAGALADQEQLDAAVGLLAKGWRRPSRPQYHHLRRAYALADLYERSGDLPRARALFDWVLKHDNEFVDTRERLRSLR
jgi:tetratricopeptide (TPR) repeat protein